MTYLTTDSQLKYRQLPSYSILSRLENKGVNICVRIACGKDKTCLTTTKDGKIMNFGHNFLIQGPGRQFWRTNADTLCI